MESLLLAEDFKEWTPSAVIAFWTAISFTIGGAASWTVNNGFKFYVQMTEFRAAQRERKLALQREQDASKPKFSADQIFEDRDIGMGYKVWMYNQTQEINSLKSSMVQLNAHYLDCIEERAQSVSRAERCEEEHKETKDQMARLQRQIQRLQRELKIEDGEEGQDDDNKPGV